MRTITLAVLLAVFCYSIYRLILAYEAMIVGDEEERGNGRLRKRWTIRNWWRG